MLVHVKTGTSLYWFYLFHVFKKCFNEDLRIILGSSSPFSPFSQLGEMAGKTRRVDADRSAAVCAGFDRIRIFTTKIVVMTMYDL